MSCGVLVVSRDPFAQARESAQVLESVSAPRRLPRAVDGGGAGHDIAEALRSAGHAVVECETPADDATGRGAVEQAWVVLSGLDLMVIVEDPHERDHRTGSMCERARELMTDRGPGGLIVWVPPGVPTPTATARLLDIADSGENLHGPAAHPLEVEPVRPRIDEPPAGPESRRRHLRLVRDPDSAAAGAPRDAGLIGGPGLPGGPAGGSV
jgi:hypothetical protein